MMLLEKDMAEIGKAVRGETCDEYRKTVQKELDILQNVKKESYYFN